MLAIGAALRAAADDPPCAASSCAATAPSSPPAWTSPHSPAAAGAPAAAARVPPRLPGGLEPRRGDDQADVCVIHGVCLGGALELALACDLRVLAEDAYVGLPETRLGLVPDLGGSSRLPQIVGVGRAKELIMTSRVIGAADAERFGLANRVAPPTPRSGDRRARRRAARLRADRRRAGQAADRRLRAPRALHHARARDRRAGAVRALRGRQGGRARGRRAPRAATSRAARSVQHLSVSVSHCSCAYDAPPLHRHRYGPAPGDARRCGISLARHGTEGPVAPPDGSRPRRSGTRSARKR